MKEFEIKNDYTLEDLPALVTRLRNRENGCAWDAEQTHDSIRQEFIEEVYEAVDAIDRNDMTDLREELGDVLLQVCMHAEMERETGGFDMDGIADGVIKKMVLRHPHVFGDVTANDTETILSNWEDIKRVEKNQKTGSDAIDAVPKAFPALVRSQKIQKRASYVGFDYPDAGSALADLDSGVDELKRAVAGEGDVFEKLGDVLFSAVYVARLAQQDSELALTRACDRFAARFRETERLAAERQIDMKSAGADVLAALWSEAKNTK